MSDIEVFNGITDLITIPKEQLAKITNRLPEYFRTREVIGHSTSQSSYSLQTMNMISDSPLSRMKQCLSQINKKYNALQESYYKIENKKLQIEELLKNTDRESMLKIQEEQSLIKSASVSMENALRQIGMFQDMYDSIKNNYNIPDNWSEADYEKQEIENMVRGSFRIAIQDISATSRVSKAAVEYWEQLGIHPQMGEHYTREYLLANQLLINNGDMITINKMYEFLDSMVDKFETSYKLALSRSGLDGIGSEQFMAEGATKPR
jgi:hypothetical protein